MDTVYVYDIYIYIYMNSENSNRSDPHRQLLNFLEKMNLKGSDKYVALSSLSIY